MKTATGAVRLHLEVDDPAVTREQLIAAGGRRREDDSVETPDGSVVVALDAG